MLLCQARKVVVVLGFLLVTSVRGLSDAPSNKLGTEPLLVCHFTFFSGPICAQVACTNTFSCVTDSTEWKVTLLGGLNQIALRHGTPSPSLGLTVKPLDRSSTANIGVVLKNVDFSGAGCSSLLFFGEVLPHEDMVLVLIQPCRGQEDTLGTSLMTGKPVDYGGSSSVLGTCMIDDAYLARPLRCFDDTKQKSFIVMCTSPPMITSTAGVFAEYPVRGWYAISATGWEEDSDGVPGFFSLTGNLLINTDEAFTPQYRIEVSIFGLPTLNWAHKVLTVGSFTIVGTPAFPNVLPDLNRGSISLLETGECTTSDLATNAGLSCATGIYFQNIVYEDFYHTFSPEFGDPGASVAICDGTEGSKFYAVSSEGPYLGVEVTVMTWRMGYTTFSYRLWGSNHPSSGTLFRVRSRYCQRQMLTTEEIGAYSVSGAGESGSFLDSWPILPEKSLLATEVESNMEGERKAITLLLRGGDIKTMETVVTPVILSLDPMSLRVRSEVPSVTAGVDIAGLYLTSTPTNAPPANTAPLALPTQSYDGMSSFSAFCTFFLNPDCTSYNTPYCEDVDGNRISMSFPMDFTTGLDLDSYEYVEGTMTLASVFLTDTGEKIASYVPARFTIFGSDNSLKGCAKMAHARRDVVRLDKTGIRRGTCVWKLQYYIDIAVILGTGATMAYLGYEYPKDWGVYSTIVSAAVGVITPFATRYLWNLALDDDDVVVTRGQVRDMINTAMENLNAVADDDQMVSVHTVSDYLSELTRNGEEASLLASHDLTQMTAVTSSYVNIQSALDSARDNGRPVLTCGIDGRKDGSTSALILDQSVSRVLCGGTAIHFSLITNVDAHAAVAKELSAKTSYVYGLGIDSKGYSIPVSMALERWGDVEGKVRFNPSCKTVFTNDPTGDVVVNFAYLSTNDPYNAQFQI